MIFFPSGTIISAPAWIRNGTTVDMMSHTVTSNLTGGAATPVYISSTLTVSNVTVLDDNEVSYMCGSGSGLSTAATLNVVGKYNTFIMTL